MAKGKLGKYPLQVSNHSEKFRNQVSWFAKNMGYGTYANYIRKLLHEDMNKHEPNMRRNPEEEGDGS